MPQNHFQRIEELMQQRRTATATMAAENRRSSATHFGVMEELKVELQQIVVVVKRLKLQ